MIDFFEEKLKKRQNQGTLRQRTISKKPKIDCTSNDYLSLANSITARLWLVFGAIFYGVGKCASKYIGGYSSLQKKLETAVAKHYEGDDALIFSSGYLASIGVLQGVCTRKTLIIADKLIHSSWIDGVFTTGAKLVRFAHNNLQELENILSKNMEKHCVILTETVFSMQGTAINVGVYVKLAERYNAVLITDSAHCLGVIKSHKISYQWHLQVGTFSKSCGGFGGYVCGSFKFIKLISNFGKTQIYSTNLPQHIIYYNLKAFNFVTKQCYGLREKSQKIAENLGFQCCGSAILVKEFETIAEAQKLQKILEKSGIFIEIVRPPTVPKPLLRLCVKKKMKIFPKL